MRCPLDQAELVMSERQGVEIDYCPTCRGVWLDRGELDKILDRAAAEQPQRAPERYASDHRSDRYPSGPRSDQYTARPRKKKESWLGDLFEFGG